MILLVMVIMSISLMIIGLVEKNQFAQIVSIVFGVGAALSYQLYLIQNLLQG